MADQPVTQVDTTATFGHTPTQAATFTDTGDFVNRTGHGLVAGDQVVFDSVATTTGLTLGVKYFVIATGITANSFKVATTAGGSAVALTTDGTGTYHKVDGWGQPVGYSASVPETSTPAGGGFSTSGQPTKAVTIDTTADTFAAAAHGYVAGDPVVFSDIVTSTGITAGQVYYVIAAGLTSGVFAVSATLGGSTIAIGGSNGTANVHKYNSGANVGSVAPVTQPDTVQANTLGAPGGNPAYAAPNLTPPAVTLPDTVKGGGSFGTTDPAYVVPPKSAPVTIADSTRTGGGESYSVNYKPIIAVAIDTTADTFTSVPDHGLVAGDPVSFSEIVTSTGVTAGQVYYVIASGLTAKVFKVSATLGGSTINPAGSNGTANVHKVVTGDQTQKTYGDRSTNLDITQIGVISPLLGAGVPDAPTSQAAVANDDGSVTVSWTAPSQVSNAPRTGYVVEGSRGSTIYAPANATSVVIEEWRIEASVAQTFTVRALNANGSGAPTAVTNSVIPENKLANGELNPVYNSDGSIRPGTGGVADAPTIGTTTVASTKHVVANWTAPTDIGSSPITGYKVTFTNITTPGISTTQTVGLVLTLDYTYTAASVGNTVKVTVKAVNARGDSVASAESNTVTLI